MALGQGAICGQGNNVGIKKPRFLNADTLTPDTAMRHLSSSDEPNQQRAIQVLFSAIQHLFRRLGYAASGAQRLVPCALCAPSRSSLTLCGWF